VYSYSYLQSTPFRWQSLETGIPKWLNWIRTRGDTGGKILCSEQRKASAFMIHHKPNGQYTRNTYQWEKIGVAVLQRSAVRLRIRIRHGRFADSSILCFALLKNLHAQPSLFSSQLHLDIHENLTWNQRTDSHKTLVYLQGICGHEDFSIMAEPRE
jgi:hypothetical protein